MPTPFAQQVYKKLRTVPKGRVTTYKALALSLNTKAYQAIGTAMKNNPYAPKVPCHRVVKSDGSIGGFKGKQTGSTIQEKIKLLETEGVTVVQGKIKSFKETLFQPKKTS